MNFRKNERGDNWKRAQICSQLFRCAKFCCIMTMISWGFFETFIEKLKAEVKKALKFWNLVSHFGFSSNHFYIKN